ncbi:MAG: hypothetical protein M0T71_10650 [Actinomycetota bacterium]|nr:hypothetical protein [Actinomycetota bacterium]
MRTFRLAAAATVGVWIGWRVGRSGLAGLVGPRRAHRDRPDRAAGPSLSVVRDRPLPVALGRLVALVELGGERGIELLQSVVGRRAGHAA